MVPVLIIITLDNKCGQLTKYSNALSKPTLNKRMLVHSFCAQIHPTEIQMYKTRKCFIQALNQSHCTDFHKTRNYKIHHVTIPSTELQQGRSRSVEY